MACLSRSTAAALLLAFAGFAPNAHAILAGGETALPPDSPAIRLDALGAASPFNAVGALAINAGGFSYHGSATALSPHWVLTAGHILDLNDNGQPDAGLGVNFHLPGFGVYSASSLFTTPGFTGFGNPSIQHDLGLLYFETPLPDSLNYPSLAGVPLIGAEVTLVGFGRSGYGDYGYTTLASLTDRRVGQNVIDSFTPDELGSGLPALFHYDFDAPNTAGVPGGSLGNAIETLIGPGDSGGPLFRFDGSAYVLVGVNTFVQGFGGRFGDGGGGVVLEPYLGWIGQTTALPVPEPSPLALLLLGWALVFRGGRGGPASTGKMSRGR
jgi:hypothetical protein